MAAKELEQSNDAQTSQAAAIIRQLEKLRTDCESSGNTIGDICCQIAITALSLIIPPKRNVPLKEEHND